MALLHFRCYCFAGAHSYVARRSSRLFTTDLSKLSASSTSVRGKTELWSTKNMYSRNFSFCWSGKKLEDIVKLDLLQDKNAVEVEAIWKEYHKELPDTIGAVLPGDDGEKILMRAKECPFFIQPIFRDEGFFILLSQFQAPSYFLFAYLEDYKSNPSNAQPLLTLSVYNDLISTNKMNLSLIRGQIIAKGGTIMQEEGEQVITQLLEGYRKDEEFDLTIRAFNKTPDKFDFYDYIARQKTKQNKATTKLE